MDLSAILLLLIVLVLVFLFISQPLAGRSRRLTHGEHELSALLAERDRLLDALQELDFDRSLGKIPAETYPAERAVLVQHGADILRQIDRLVPAPVSGAAPGEAEDELEKTIAARRAARLQNTVQPGPSDEELEDLIARRRSARNGKVGGFCPRCGKPVLQSDAFCSSCGNALK